MRKREGLARRESWSSAGSDTRAKRSLKKIKGRARKGVGESSGAHVRLIVSMALTVVVEFGIEVEEGVKNGDGGWQVRKDESRDDIATKLEASDDK